MLRQFFTKTYAYLQKVASDLYESDQTVYSIEELIKDQKAQSSIDRLLKHCHENLYLGSPDTIRKSLLNDILKTFFSVQGELIFTLIAELKQNLSTHRKELAQINQTFKFSETENPLTPELAFRIEIQPNPDISMDGDNLERGRNLTALIEITIKKLQEARSKLTKINLLLGYSDAENSETPEYSYQFANEPRLVPTAYRATLQSIYGNS